MYKNFFNKTNVVVTNVLIVLMTLTFVSCKPKTSTTVNGEKGAEQPVTLKLFVTTTSGSDYDNFSTQYTEEKANVKLDITATPGDELENKLNVLLASGERPDIIQYHNDEIEQKYVNSNLLLPLSDYFDKTPNLLKSRSDEIWNTMKHKDGKIYAVGIKTKSVHFTNVYRKDWLDALGLDVPETIEQYYEVADAISNKDPNGSGIKDTYAFGAPGASGNSWTKYFDHIFGAFGVLPEHWILKDGNVVNGSVQSEAKEALKFLNKMYVGKMIDPEFITDDDARTKNKYRAGIYGAQSNFIWMFDKNNLNNYYEPFKQKNPDGEYVQGTILKGPSESLGMRKINQRGWLKTAIVKESKNIEAALRLFDWCASEEGVMFQNYGLEGEHYTIDENNVVKQTISADEQKKLGINQLYVVREALFKHTTPEFSKVADEAERTGVGNIIDGIIIPETGQYEKELANLTASQYFKMIIGEIDIDSGFEEYVNEWNKRGGAEYTKVLNEEYQERNKQ